MKTLYKISIFIIIILFVSSCEKVIEVDLENAKQQIVVDANINNGTGNNYIKLTKSGSFYDSNEFETVKGANVLITDNNGNSFIFNEITDGVFRNDTLNIQELTEYKLRIITEGKTITSSSTMPNIINIDSLTVEENNGIFGGGNNDKENDYKIFVHFKDPSDKANYYRIKFYINGEYIPEINIFNDALLNGQEVKYPIMSKYLYIGDIVTIDLICIDKANYEYYRLLAENSMGAMSTAVGNPISNVVGEDVIGVFGANAIDSEVVSIDK